MIAHLSDYLAERKRKAARAKIEVSNALQGGTLSMSGSVVTFEGFSRDDAENVFDALLILAGARS